MPTNYAQKMIDMMNRTGQPQTSTTTGKTTVTTPKETEGLDIGSLMMMLLMGMMFKNPKAGLAEASSPEALMSSIAGPRGGYTPLAGSPGTATLGTTDAARGYNPLTTTSAGYPKVDLQMLVQLLSSLGGTLGGAR